MLPLFPAETRPSVMGPKAGAHVSISPTGVVTNPHDPGKTPGEKAGYRPTATAYMRFVSLTSCLAISTFCSARPDARSAFVASSPRARESSTSSHAEHCQKCPHLRASPIHRCWERGSIHRGIPPIFPWPRLRTEALRPGRLPSCRSRPFRQPRRSPSGFHPWSLDISFSRSEHCRAV